MVECSSDRKSNMRTLPSAPTEANISFVLHKSNHVNHAERNIDQAAIRLDRRASKIALFGTPPHSNRRLLFQHLQVAGNKTKGQVNTWNGGRFTSS